MLADALGRLRGKVKYVPAVLAALLPETFPLRDLHAALEAVSGRPLVLQNVRRLFLATAALVEPTGALEPAAPSSGPRDELLRFRAEHRDARLDPSLRLPWAPLPPP